MLKKIVLQVLLLTSLVSYSQVRFGIRGTVHTSNVSEIHAESDKRIAGSLGGLIQIPLSYDNQYFIQSEISYSLQGEKDKLGKYPGSKNIDFFQNYINIPVYFRAYFSEADSEFFGEIGPQIGFLVSQKEKKKDRELYGDKPKNIDVSIGIGVGYSFLRRYELFLRYNYGLTDVYKDYHGQQRSSILGFGVAYIFD